jgi:hypothetical protein
MRVAEGDLGFGPQSDLRLTYMEADAGLLVIGLTSPVDALAEAEPLTREVWDSISIGP